MLAVRHVSEDGATDEVAVTLRYRFAHRAKLRVAQGSRA